MSLRLVRLPSGAWGLLAVPDSQHVATKRRAESREVLLEERAEPRRLPFLASFPTAGVRA